MLGLWAWCKNAQAFFYEYIYQTQSTTTPLILAGMDCQLQSPYSFEHIATKVGAILSKLSSSQQDSINSNIAVTNLPTTFFNGQKADPEGCEKGLAALTRLLQQHSLQQLSQEERITISNVLAAFQNILPFLQNQANNSTKHLYRDRQMFNKVQHLLQYKYPKEKAIIRAHNAHIMKSPHAFTDNKDSVLMLGQLLGNAQMNPYPYYSIGFTSYNASSRWTTSIT